MLIDEDLIEPSLAPFCAPIVWVRKPSGKLHATNEYRWLNKATISDTYPLPRIDDSLDWLSNCKWFSSMDLASRFLQVPLKKQDHHKSTFGTEPGLFQYKVMPIGLLNSATTFQRLMELVLAGLPLKSYLLHFDDILIVAPSVELQFERLAAGSQALLKANLKLLPKKTHLFQPCVKFLGHIVSITHHDNAPWG